MREPDPRCAVCSLCCRLNLPAGKPTWCRSCISQPAVSRPTRATEMRASSSLLQPMAVASLNGSEPPSGCLLLADDVDLVLAHGSLRSASHWRITADASTMSEVRVAPGSPRVEERRIEMAALSRPSSTITYRPSRGKSLRAAYPLLPLQPPEFPNASLLQFNVQRSVWALRRHNNTHP